MLQAAGRRLVPLGAAPAAAGCTWMAARRLSGVPTGPGGGYSEEPGKEGAGLGQGDGRSCLLAAAATAAAACLLAVLFLTTMLLPCRRGARGGHQ